MPAVRACDGTGVSAEVTYAGADDAPAARVLLARSGRFLKKPSFAYTQQFAQPAATFELLPPPGAAIGGGGEAAPPTIAQLPSPAPSTSALAAAGRAPGSEVTFDITYLSERMWISRRREPVRSLTQRHRISLARHAKFTAGCPRIAQAGGLMVLQRCDERALAPPASRADLTAPCSETLWGGERLCRRQPLF